jgi:outer membrane protein assembly factor BamE
LSKEQAVKYLTIGILLISISACAHKIDIQQGNVLTKEMLEQLHVGMNELQVQSVLGSPLVVDAFHKDRWDYVYSMKLGDSKEFQFSYVTLFFKKRLLNEIKVHAEPIAEKDLITPELISAGRS